MSETDSKTIGIAATALVVSAIAGASLIPSEEVQEERAPTPKVERDPGYKRDGTHLRWFVVPKAVADNLAAKDCIKQNSPRLNLAGTRALIAWRRNECGVKPTRLANCEACEVIGNSNAEVQTWIADHARNWVPPEED